MTYDDHEQTSDAATQGGTVLSRRQVLLSGTAIAGVSLMAPTVLTKPAAAQGFAAKGAQNGTVSKTPFGTPTSAIRTPGENITATRGDRASNWPGQTRSEVLARHGVVATSQSVAAQAGLQILQSGGNAAAAAVATAASLAVVEPYSHGLGGDTFIIYYSARDRRLYGLNASGWAPAAWSPSYFNELGYDAETGMPVTGTNTITVPGAVDGWYKLLERFGNMGFDEVLGPAERTADEGFGVTERIHGDWRAQVEGLRENRYAAKTYLVEGKAPELYSIFRNPDMAHALRVLRRQGRDAFYEGEIAKAIIETIRRGGGNMSRDDLRSFHAQWVDPVSTDYHGYDVYEMPPNSQGFAALEMLNILEACDTKLGSPLSRLGPKAPEYWHLLIEAKKLAYSDLYTYNADPRFEEVPLDRLLSKEYAAELCEKIDPEHASEPKVTGDTEGGTIYLTAADRWGNMVSFISSVYYYFGSNVGVPDYGFLLQNRGSLFSLDGSHPNVVAPRKRPFHTIIPAFVMKDGQPLLSFGNMGGSMQPQGQVQELVNMINRGMNVQAAGDATRFRHNQDDNTLQLESNLYGMVGEQLAAMGHEVEPSTGSPMGGYQAILFTPDSGDPSSRERDLPLDERPINGVYRAGSDHRKDGEVVGW